MTVIHERVAGIPGAEGPAGPDQVPVRSVRARASEIQRLAKALESVGIKLDSVVSDVTGKSSGLMIEGLTGGERRGRCRRTWPSAGCAPPRKLADLSRALADLSRAPADRFSGHHAGLHRDRIALFSAAASDLEARIAVKAALADTSWSNHKLVHRFGAPKNPPAVKKASLAVARTLLKIACQVADFHTSGSSPEQRLAYLLRQLERLSPGCSVTITAAEAASRPAPRRSR